MRFARSAKFLTQWPSLALILGALCEEPCLATGTSGVGPFTRLPCLRYGRAKLPGPFPVRDHQTIGRVRTGERTMDRTVTRRPNALEAWLNGLFKRLMPRQAIQPGTGRFFERRNSTLNNFD